MQQKDKLTKTKAGNRARKKRRTGRQKKMWEDKMKEWTGLDFASSARALKTELGGRGCCKVTCGVPTT